MKADTVTTYTCDFCGWQSRDKHDVALCEEHHMPIVGFMHPIFHVSIDPDENALPRYVVAIASDGRAYRYDLSWPTPAGAHLNALDNPRAFGFVPVRPLDPEERCKRCPITFDPGKTECSECEYNPRSQRC